jgi:hypothetical protein
VTTTKKLSTSLEPRIAEEMYDAACVSEMAVALSKYLRVSRRSLGVVTYLLQIDNIRQQAWACKQGQANILGGGRCESDI